jgi:hypothetical protein
MCHLTCIDTRPPIIIHIDSCDINRQHFLLMLLLLIMMTLEKFKYYRHGVCIFCC